MSATEKVKDRKLSSNRQSGKPSYLPPNQNQNQKQQKEKEKETEEANTTEKFVKNKEEQQQECNKTDKKKFDIETKSNFPLPSKNICGGDKQSEECEAITLKNQKEDAATAIKTSNIKIDKECNSKGALSRIDKVVNQMNSPKDEANTIKSKEQSPTTLQVDSIQTKQDTKYSTTVPPNKLSNDIQIESLTLAISAYGSSPPLQSSEITPEATVPENILSPPKSETQTDDTNTATSSSPHSDSQLSPIVEHAMEKSTPERMAGKVGSKSTKIEENKMKSKIKSGQTQSTTKTIGTVAAQKPINVVANGTIPKSGKPFMLNQKPNKSATRSIRPRKPKALVPMYESEISDNKVGIKLCIKKSDASNNVAQISAAAAAIAAGVGVARATKTTTGLVVVKETTGTASPTARTNRKRSRKPKARPRIESDDSEYEGKRKKDRATNNNVEQRQKKVSFCSSVREDSAAAKKEAVEQSIWGERLPEDVLLQIFQIVVERDGCLPTLFRLGRVCSLWRRVSLTPSLWKVMDLSTWVKEKYRNEMKLKWFVDNRCSQCTELNVSTWKVSDINCFLNKLSKGCPNLQGITLAGWKNFTCEHLSYLVENMKKLERLDLSSVNVEMNASKTAVGVQSMCNALQTLNGRLTHIYLAHNRLAGIPQIVNVLSSHCPNLLLLDLSNITTQASSHGVLHIEKLQHGCPKLKVLLITNSQVTLSQATMQEMMDSPGFPELEELSVAVTLGDARVIGDEHVQRILKTSSKLKLLDVRGCARLTHESLIRLPAWDIKHLFLSGCSVNNNRGSGLELIASKWAHSLIELDLAWANVQEPLDNALKALAEKGAESPLAHLNLCGSSVSEEAVKEILAHCANMSSINLASCRGLPRGVKRLVQGPQELQELRDVLKVQMKVKLPSEIKEQEDRAAELAAATESKSQITENEIKSTPAVNKIEGYDDDGGGGSSVANQDATENK